MFMMAMAVDKIGITKSFEIIFKLKLFMLLFIISMSIIGIIPNAFIQVNKGIGTVHGYGFGFTHPNKLASSVCFLILCYICWKNEKLKFRHIFMLDIITLMTFYVTKCRTILYCVLIFNSIHFARKNCTHKEIN